MLKGIVNRQLQKVIDWKDNTQDTLVYTVKLDADQLVSGSTLIVKPSQVAILEISDGSTESSAPLNVVDNKYESEIVGITQTVQDSAASHVKGMTSVREIFGPGTYEINTKVMPIISDFLGAFRGFQSNIKTTIKFVSVKMFTGQGWGTTSKFHVYDVNLGDQELGAYGTYAFSIINPDLFVQRIAATDENFTIREFCGGDSIGVQKAGGNPVVNEILMALPAAIDMLFNGCIDLVQLQARRLDLAEIVEKVASTRLKETMGIKVSLVAVGGLALPDIVTERMREAAAVRGQGGFAAARAITAMESMRNMSESASGGGIASTFAQAGLGMSMGRNMAREFAQGVGAPENSVDLDAQAKETHEKRTKMYKSATENESLDKSNPTASVKCSCGYTSDKQFKFCPECGQKAPDNIPKFCPECGAKNGDNSKFCSECGNKF